MSSRREFLENLGGASVAVAFTANRPEGTAKRALEASAASGSDIRKFLALSQKEKEKYLRARGIEVQLTTMNLREDSKPIPLDLRVGSEPILRWWKKGCEWVGLQVTFLPGLLDDCNKVFVEHFSEGYEGDAGRLDDKYVRELVDHNKQIDAFIAGPKSVFRNPGEDSFENFFWRSREMPLYGEVLLFFSLERYRYFPHERRTLPYIEKVRRYVGTNMPKPLPLLRK